MARKRLLLYLFPVGQAFDRVAVDILGPLPLSKLGNRYIIVFSDYLTRWPEAFAIPTMDAPLIAKLFFQEIICRHGSPRTLLSDRGKNFLSKLMLEICAIVNTKKINTTAYRPQTDGLVERFNATLAQSLSMFVSDHQKDWDLFLHGILLAYRTSPSATTGDTPFYLLYGREPLLPPDVSLLPPTTLPATLSSYRSSIVQNIALAQKLAIENTQKTQQHMKTTYDKNSKSTSFEVGQKVWVFNPKRTTGLSPKLQHKYHGPYRLTEKLSDVNFQLTDLQNKIISTSIHVNRFKHWVDPDLRDIRQPPPELDTNLTPKLQFVPDETVRTISPIPTSDAPRIVKHRLVKGGLQYLVQPSGFSASAATWIPRDQITDNQLISSYVNQPPSSSKISSAKDHPPRVALFTLSPQLPPSHHRTPSHF